MRAERPASQEEADTGDGSPFSRWPAHEVAADQAILPKASTWPNSRKYMDHSKSLGKRPTGFGGYGGEALACTGNPARDLPSITAVPSRQSAMPDRPTLQELNQTFKISILSGAQ